MIAQCKFFQESITGIHGASIHGIRKPADYWDETKILEAKVSDYIITVRKKGEDWYIVGMTDWTPREFKLQLDFLDNGIYKAELCTDGVNAGTYPSDYLIQTFSLEKTKPLTVKMAPGGGFLLTLVKN
jgi:alpha-glucosidase